ncbi:hypothetical protein J7E45_17815 [Microbacterium sp. ISL-59]|uniref:hypothetical protein n=1 Tax=Microbacterium sp. ISL-59 TaxID=2819159 RepID=UPI001BEAE9ED|nr:hypothetical protein [Microbacterium sp. ISL-59]MBT2497466.1 hypothetical protein [Microbacterium sp. ISL-59]
MKWIDGTDWNDIKPEFPAPILGGLVEVAGSLLAAAVMFVATLAALFILIKREGEKSGPVLSYAAAVLLSVLVSAVRADWSTLVYVVLILPAFFGFRWLFRRMTSRY